MTHPCAINPELEGCAETILQHAATKVAGEAPVAAVATIQEVIVANAGMLTAHVNAALSKVGEWVEATETLAAEQMPLLVQEIIWFEVVDRGFWVVLGVIGLLWGAFAFRWSIRNAQTRIAAEEAHTKALTRIKDDRNEYSAETVDCAFTALHYAVPISGGIFGLLGLFWFLCNVIDMLKPLVAPRLFLIEYFRQLTG